MPFVEIVSILEYEVTKRIKCKIGKGRKKVILAYFSNSKTSFEKENKFRHCYWHPSVTSDNGHASP